jgi:hypothetical protein
MGIVCAAVVGQQNNPLYIKTLSPVDDEVKFHYMVHASLDAVEEKVGNCSAHRLYLGCEGGLLFCQNCASLQAFFMEAFSRCMVHASLDAVSGQECEHLLQQWLSGAQAQQQA